MGLLRTNIQIHPYFIPDERNIYCYAVSPYTAVEKPGFEYAYILVTTTSFFHSCIHALIIALSTARSPFRAFAHSLTIIHSFIPFSFSHVGIETPTEQTKEEVETMNTTTITPTRVTFSIRPELLTPETITTEATESESSGQDDGSESDEDSNDLKKSDS